MDWIVAHFMWNMAHLPQESDPWEMWLDIGGEG